MSSLVCKILLWLVAICPLLAYLYWAFFPADITYYNYLYNIANYKQVRCCQTGAMLSNTAKTDPIHGSPSCPDHFVVFSLFCYRLLHLLRIYGWLLGEDGELWNMCRASRQVWVVDTQELLDCQMHHLGVWVPFWEIWFKYVQFQHSKIFTYILKVQL